MIAALEADRSAPRGKSDRNQKRVSHALSPDIFPDFVDRNLSDGAIAKIRCGSWSAAATCQIFQEADWHKKKRGRRESHPGVCCKCGKRNGSAGMDFRQWIAKALFHRWDIGLSARKGVRISSAGREVCYDQQQSIGGSRVSHSMKQEEAAEKSLSRKRSGVPLTCPDREICIPAKKK